MGDLHEIKRTSLLDAPQRLHELADELAKRPELSSIVVVIGGYPRGLVAVRAYGERTSGLETTGWLARGLAAMTDGAGVEDNLAAGQSAPEPPQAA